jgi:hypothetical protein
MELPQKYGDTIDDKKTMKMNIPGLLAFVVVLGCGVTTAKDEAGGIVLKETLSKVPAAEVPAKAADIVAQAEAGSRAAIAVDVVKASLKMNPTMATAIVGAICRTSPETAPTVAATAAGIQPRQVKLIAQAAAAAAPAKAGEIVKAVCKEAPAAYREVALAVAQVAPKAAKEILAGLSEAVPALKEPIAEAVASYKGQPLAVAPVIDRIAPSGAPGAPPKAALTPLRGPTIGGPYVPYSGTATNVPPNGGNVPPGGRNYAAP